MSTKIKNITLVVLFSLFLFGLAFWSWMKPSDLFSESERRALAEKPKFSLETTYAPPPLG